jgi:molecular chaperone GrpE (heat shock protein)
MALAERIASLEKQVAFLPPQVRMLAAKVDGLTTAITEPRVRALLMGLLGIYDLVDQVLRTMPPQMTDVDRDHLRNYQVLRSQLQVLLDSNGLCEIKADGAFDPLVHRALQSVAVDAPEKADRVMEVVRPGFRTEQSILRYAEVVVGRYSAALATLADPEASGDSAVPSEGGRERSGDTN